MKTVEIRGTIFVIKNIGSVSRAAENPHYGTSDSDDLAFTKKYRFIVDAGGSIIFYYDDLAEAKKDCDAVIKAIEEYE